MGLRLPRSLEKSWTTNNNNNKMEKGIIPARGRPYIFVVYNKE